MLERNGLCVVSGRFDNRFLIVCLCFNKLERKQEGSSRILALCQEDFLKPFRSVDFEFLFSSKKLHGRQQTYKTKEMVSMQMAYKDFVNLGVTYAVFC